MDSKCRATVTLLLVICLNVILQAGAVTHICDLKLGGKESSLLCKQLRDAPASCNLVVYHHAWGRLVDDAATMIKAWTDDIDGAPPVLLIKPPFGVDARPLPPLPAWNSVQHDATEQMLNRTEPVYKAAVWPMLYFHGGPSCNLVLTADILGVFLAEAKEGNSSALLAFGGGLNATLVDSFIALTDASSAVMVLADSSLNVQDTLFYGNRVSKGTIYASWSSRLAVNGTLLAQSRAEREGGGIYLVGSNGTVSASNLTLNVAEEGGGAIYAKFSSLSVDSTLLAANAAPIGGAVAVYNNSHVVITSGSSLENNTARILKPEAVELPSSADHDTQGDVWARTQKLMAQAGLASDNHYTLGVGGALYVERSTVNISHSRLLRNKAVIDGGAVRVQMGQLSISNSHVDYNKAHRHGGALFIGTDEKEKAINSTLTVYDTTLDNNVAEANGGGIMLERRAHTNIINSKFGNSHAWSEGGAICTVMAGVEDGLTRSDDLQTVLHLRNVSFYGTSANDKLFIGPYFRLNISSTGNNNLTWSSPGIVYRRRLCSRGERVGPSNYCEECPPYEFSTVVGEPGHQERNCTRVKDTDAYAPGGAVLVPGSGGWHGFSESVRNCTGCPPLNATLGDIRKCPNPAACQHQPEMLAIIHPYSQRQDRLNWPLYGTALCDYHDGYEGVLCGECIRPGFGMTAPFKCNRCVGVSMEASMTVDQDGNPIYAFFKGGGRIDYNAGKASPVHISLTYLAYWFALTCWILYIVRSSMLLPAKQRKVASSVQTKAAAAAQAGKSPPAEDALGQNSNHDTSPGNLPDQGTTRATDNMHGDIKPGQPVNEKTKSLDITKALVVYAQWAMLIMNLPTSWLPWASTESHSPVNGIIRVYAMPMIERVVSWFSGRSASLDCALQAWNLLQANTAQTIIRNTFTRAIASTIIVPLVLFLSVLLLQLLGFALRKPFLRALDRLCANSEFCRRYLSGMLVAPGAGFGQRPDEESPDLGATSSASSAGSKWSFLSLGEGTGLGAGSWWGSFKDSVVATALASSMFVYLTIARVAFGMLMCVRVGSSQRWVMDVRLECPTSRPAPSWGGGAVFFGVVLLLVCVAWPVGIAWVLIRSAHRGKLMPVTSDGAVSSTAGPSEDAADAEAAAHSTARLAIRYADYAVDFDGLKVVPSSAKPSVLSSLSFFGSDAWLVRLRMYSVLAWDSVVDLHRLTIALVSTCVMLQETHQLILLVLALGSYLLLVLAVRPWRAKTVWRLQVLALAILIASCLGIMACTVGDATAFYSNAVYVSVIPWLVLCANLGYLVLLIVLLVRCVMREVPTLADVKKKLRKRWRKLRMKLQGSQQRGGAGPQAV